ncbi:hypothetical protein ACQ4PT_029543 [Festuca glaucescens]
MANFPVDPHHFVPAGFHVLGPLGADERPARMYVTAPAAPPRRHESWAIAQVVPRPEDEDIDQVLNQEGWDNMQQQQPNLQQQSSITFQYSAASDSSIHLIPGGGPIFEIVVEPAPVEIVEIEDITDEVDEDVAVVNHVVVANEMIPVNELAIVPYVNTMLQQLLSQHNTVSEFSGGSSHVDSSAFFMPVSDLATGSAITTDVVSRRLILEEINGNIALHKEDNSTAQESASILLAMELENEEVAKHVVKKRGTGKQETTESEAGVRRSTRQSFMKNGYKLEPMRDQPTPKKKPRCKPMKKSKIGKPMEGEQEDLVTPITPIKTLQQVGLALGIPAEDLTEEKLVAAPANNSSQKF